MIPGNKPASNRPRNHLAAIKPDQFSTKPMKVIVIPQKILRMVSCHCSLATKEIRAHMIMGMKIEGRRRFNRTFVKGSKTAYDTKKMDSVALYLPVDM